MQTDGTALEGNFRSSLLAASMPLQLFITCKTLIANGTAGLHLESGGQQEAAEVRLKVRLGAFVPVEVG